MCIYKHFCYKQIPEKSPYKFYTSRLMLQSESTMLHCSTLYLGVHCRVYCSGYKRIAYIISMDQVEQCQQYTMLMVGIQSKTFNTPL